MAKQRYTNWKYSINKDTGPCLNNKLGVGTLTHLIVTIQTKTCSGLKPKSRGLITHVRFIVNWTDIA